MIHIKIYGCGLTQTFALRKLLTTINVNRDLTIFVKDRRNKVIRSRFPRYLYMIGKVVLKGNGGRQGHAGLTFVREEQVIL